MTHCNSSPAFTRSREPCEGGEKETQKRNKDTGAYPVFFAEILAGIRVAKHTPPNHSCKSYTVIIFSACSLRRLDSSLCTPSQAPAAYVSAGAHPELLVKLPLLCLLVHAVQPHKLTPPSLSNTEAGLHVE